MEEQETEDSEDEEEAQVEEGTESDMVKPTHQCSAYVVKKRVGMIYFLG